MTGREFYMTLSGGMYTLVCLLLLSITVDLKGQSVPNDHIFPAATAARAYIDFDAKGFVVNGRREFLVSAGLEYARIPHELWYDRLLRLQRAGFNCVEIYTFWNFHEPSEGRFDFSGDHDLGAFLELVKRMGMYAIVRVGPYYCAEWDNGGYPLWLRFKPGVRVREDSREFEKYVDRFFDKLMPIVSRNQINHGGAVIMVQLENEHPQGWGTDMPNGYFRHLREKALSLGLEVPYFFSGLHHSYDPGGDREAAGKAGGEEVGDPARLDDTARPNPWFSTEFWSVWYTGYGSTEKEARMFERRTWKVITHGGNGYNYYMAHGGSNFGYTNNDEDAASYDYGAAVGQAGDLRPIYYSFKRPAWLARSVGDILENSVDGTPAYRGRVPDTTIHITARHSPAGDLVFADNPSDSLSKSFQFRAGKDAGREDYRLPAQKPLILAPGEILPFIHDFRICPGIMLKWAPVRVLGIQKQGNTTTIVIYGDAGSPAELYFSVHSRPFVMAGAAGVLVKREAVSYRGIFSDSMSPVVVEFTVGGQVMRVMAMNRELADRTWFVEAAGHSYVVCGPAYAGDVQVHGGDISLNMEVPYGGKNVYCKKNYPIWLYGERNKKRLIGEGGVRKVKAVVKKDAAGQVLEDRVVEDKESRKKEEAKRNMASEHALTLDTWQMKDATEPAAVDFDDHTWTAGDRPLQMGSDGDGSADAWYRTVVFADSSGEYTLQVDVGDRATVFVDGVFATSGNIHDGAIHLTIDKGRHVLAVFTAHDGRDKLASFLGVMEGADRKGLSGPAMLVKGHLSRHELGDWRFFKVPALLTAEQQLASFPSGNEEGWKKYTIGDDAFGLKQGFGWFRVVLPEPPRGVTQGQLDFRSVDENATVFINGRKLARQEGWNQPFQVRLDRLDTLQKPIVLTLFVENYSNEGGIDRPVRMSFIKHTVEITGWRMRGGPGDPDTIKVWSPLKKGSVDSGRGPCFYRTEFIAPAYSDTGFHPIWRVSTKGLGHGSVWVNGHHLGRYPEKTPAPGLYIPECWMKAGRNTLIIYDEDGQSPGQVAVLPEVAAGRYLSVFSNY
jgi:beta-galactosidase